MLALGLTGGTGGSPEGGGRLQETLKGARREARTAAVGAAGKIECSGEEGMIPCLACKGATLAEMRRSRLPHRGEQCLPIVHGLVALTPVYCTYMLGS